MSQDIASGKPSKFGATRRILVWASCMFFVGILIANLIRIGGVVVEGRLLQFSESSPSQVIKVVNRDPFAERVAGITSLAVVHNIYSPLAGTFAVWIDGYNAQLEKVFLLCRDLVIISIAPRSEKASFLTSVPWPCHELILVITRDDTNDRIVARVELDPSQPDPNVITATRD